MRLLALMCLYALKVSKHSEVSLVCAVPAVLTQGLD